MKSILIKDTTKEEREQIIKHSLDCGEDIRKRTYPQDVDGTYKMTKSVVEGDDCCDYRLTKSL